MDLRIAFEKLIRVGNLQVSTAGGSTFTFGDGTGRPVAIRTVSRTLGFAHSDWRENRVYAHIARGVHPLDLSHR
jgi:hypothetical protein